MQLYFIKIPEKGDPTSLVIWLHAAFEFVLTHMELQVPIVNKYDFAQNNRVSIFNSLKGSCELATSGYKVSSTDVRRGFMAEDEWREYRGRQLKGPFLTSRKKKSKYKIWPK